jgi:hypothetical protein
MENAHQLESWRDLYVMLGTSAAALLGLLFVVTSMHLDEMVSNPGYRNRARNNSIFLILMIVEAAFILTPQPARFLGLELIAANLFGLTFPIRTGYLYFYRNSGLGKSGGIKPYRAIIFFGSFLLGIGGGVCLIEESIWGLYLATTGYVTLLASVSMNAWSIMLGLGHDEKTKKDRQKA